MVIIYATIDAKAPIESESTRVCVEFAKTSLTEHGCLTYLFTVDLEDPKRMHVLERWESEEDLQAHMGTPRSAEFAKFMNNLAAGVNVNRMVGEDQSESFREHSKELMGDSVRG
ncbi:MAG: Antibiotic biosynthesis monooxygenase [Chloroflexota bacterium]|jgi:quinol monooxygenase YgiN|nr:Antibiotic biosynthesis monooxygenase [Chloroflexota bacterium]